MIHDRLIATQEETLPFFSLSDTQLSKSYASDKWDVRFLLCHIVDTETIFYMRIRRALSEPRPVIWSIDQDRWASQLDYCHVNLSTQRTLYEATRHAVIELAQRFYDSHGHLEFVHSDAGVRTVKDEIDKVAWHNAHHNAQIKTALTL